MAFFLVFRSWTVVLIFIQVISTLVSCNDEVREKRAFDRIDNGMGGLNKRHFDRFDAGSFGSLSKKAFDKLDTSPFGFNKRRFDMIDTGSFDGLEKR